MKPVTIGELVEALKHLPSALLDQPIFEGREHSWVESGGWYTCVFCHNGAGGPSTPRSCPSDLAPRILSKPIRELLSNQARRIQ